MARTKGKNRGLSDSDLDGDSDVASAPAPFDLSIKGSDVILRSSPDRVDFLVHKQILSLASSIFEDMFALPQPPPDSSSEVRSEPDWLNGLPVVHVTEDADTLKRLLLLAYPYPDPALETVEQVGRVYEARRKYEIRAGDTAIDAALNVLMKSDPVGVFAIAGHAGDSPLAKRAAAATLALRVRDLKSPQLAMISASTFRALLDYRFLCEDAVSELATPRKFRTPNKAWTHTSAQSPFQTQPVALCTRQREPNDDRDVWLSGWWMEFLEAARAKLRDYPPSDDSLYD